MAIPATAVGRDLGQSVLSVTPRMTMAYAAGLGASDACYLDDLRPGGIVAPPPFCVVLEWPLVSGPAFRELTRTSDAQGWGSIHVSQDSFFHKPIRPGRSYLTRGLLTQVRPTRVGACIGAKLVTCERDSGAPVVTSWFAAIVLGVEVEGPATVAEQAPELEPIATADANRLAWTSIAIARQLPHVYTECASIWNPIHTERAVARSVGLPDIILHGTATWALAGLGVVQRLAGGDPTRLRRLGGHFKGRVIPGSIITLGCHADGSDSGGVQFEVRNAEGEVALANGRATLAASAETTKDPS